MICCKHLMKRYSEHVCALSDVSIKIENGEYVSITGKSGSGKSTLLNIMGLIDIPTSGEIYLNGKDMNSTSEVKKAEIRNKEIGYIFQSFYLEGAYTVYKNVEMPLLIAGVNSKERKQRVIECLDKVGMGHKIKELAKNLSGGEQQRISIARALANHPNIILADEPCGNLDSENTQNIMCILEELNKMGKTVVLVTHSMEEANRAGRKIIMKDGTIVKDEKK